eukprot:COSAG04_NODE_9515_length_856_cov_1.548217_1_plen_235_part_00
MIFSPRQARDKHRESTQQQTVFLQRPLEGQAMVDSKMRRSFFQPDVSETNKTRQDKTRQDTTRTKERQQNNERSFVIASVHAICSGNAYCCHLPRRRQDKTTLGTDSQKQTGNGASKTESSHGSFCCASCLVLSCLVLSCLVVRLCQDHARIFAGVEQVEQASAEMVRIMSSALEEKPSSGGGGGGGSAGIVDIVGALRECIPALDGYAQYCANQVRRTPLLPQRFPMPVLVKR